jgi:hypothetical protein
MQNFFAPQKQRNSVSDLSSVFATNPDLSAGIAGQRNVSQPEPEQRADYSGYEDIYNTGYEQPEQQEEPVEDERYPTPVMDEFTRTVLNPPQRTGPSKMRMLGTGLLSALQGSTGPESRVPLYNEKGKVVGSRESGFWESLGNKPYNVAQANAILDMPYDAQVEDFKTKTGELYKAAGIEKTQEEKAAQAELKRAQARAKPVEAQAAATRAGAAVTTADAAKKRADTDAFINNMTKSEQLEAIQKGQITLAEVEAAARSRIVDKQTTSAEKIATDRNTAAVSMNNADNAALMQRVIAQNTAALARIEAGGGTVANIPDPNDPTKQIAVFMNPRTRKWEPITTEAGQNVGPISKPGAPSAKAGQESAKEVERLAAARSKAEEGIRIIDQYILDKNGKLTDDAKWMAGGSRNAQTFRFPGMPGYDANSATETLRGKVLVDLIAEMKKLSPTGSVGMGNLSNEDRKALERAASMLDAGLSEEAFEREVGVIRRAMAKMMEPSSKPIEVPVVPPRNNQGVPPGTPTNESREQRAKRLRGQYGAPR